MRYLPPIEPPDRLLVCDMSGLDKHQHLTYVALQGIANRRQARVYLVAGKEPSSPDRFWLDFYQDEFGIAVEQASAEDLMRSLRDEVAGYAVYDPRFGSTANLAMTLAGLENVLPVSPEQAPALDRLGMEKLYDFSGQFPDRLAAYRWGIKELLPRCSRRILGHSRTVFPGERAEGVGGPSTDASCRDLIIAAGGFMFDVGLHGEQTFPGSDEEEAIVASIYAHMDPLALILGWMYWWEDRPLPWEMDYVRRNTLGGLNTVCGGAPNMSVHCSLRPDEPPRQGHADPDALRIEDKVYVMFGVSDGDALWCIHNLWSGEWNDPNRGAVPLGWSLNPMITEYAPGIYRYLLKTRTENDYFVSCISGAGYVEASLCPHLEQLAELTDFYHAQSDMRVIMGFNDAALDADQYGDFGRIKTEKIPAYLRQPHILGVEEGYGPRYSPEKSWDEQNFFASGKPWVTNLYEDDFTWFENVSAEKVIRGVRKVAKNETRRPLFLPVFLGLPHGIRYASFVEIASALRQDGIEVLRPDAFMLALAKAKRDGLVDGTTIGTDD